MEKFFSNVLRTQRFQESLECERLVSSFAQDMIYGITRGRVKTSKHLTLGMALKSLTSSKKIIEIINRAGHCCSYTVVEELETELAFFCTDSNRVCPS